MANIEFFKQQAKRFMKDFNSRCYNEKEGFYEYSPCYFSDLEFIILAFEIDEDDKFTLMNAQHIVSKLAGFYNWNELIKASEPRLEIGKHLLVNREKFQHDEGLDIVDFWKTYESQNLKGFDDETKLEIFKIVILRQ